VVGIPLKAGCTPKIHVKEAAQLAVRLDQCFRVCEVEGRSTQFGRGIRQGMEGLRRCKVQKLVCNECACRHLAAEPDLHAERAAGVVLGQCFRRECGSPAVPSGLQLGSCKMRKRPSSIGGSFPKQVPTKYNSAVAFSSNPWLRIFISSINYSRQCSEKRDGLFDARMGSSTVRCHHDHRYCAVKPVLPAP
jgi:hypothetical protein